MTATEPEPRFRVLVLLGPTAAGKTEMSIRLAQELGAEIISCDSMLVYRGMEIGTAKPTPAERSLVPHHMIDVVDPDDEFTVADYKDRVDALIRELNQCEVLPMLVGGTALYLRAVLADYPIVNVAPDEALRSRLREEARRLGREALHARLAEVDPTAAARIHPNDLKRVVRALEVYEKTGRQISQAQENTTASSPYDYFKIGLRVPRSILYERINQRVDHMVREGLIDEVRKLLDRGIDPSLHSMQSLGYREVSDYLAQKHDLEETLRLIKRNTRHFARRQLSWFRRESDVVWVDMYEDGGVERRSTGAVETEILDLVAGKWPDLAKNGHIR